MRALLYFQSAILPCMHCDGTHREREVKVVLETAGGERWKGIEKLAMKTEGDGGQSPWTYALQGVKGNKLSLLYLIHTVKS